VPSCDPDIQPQVPGASACPAAPDGRLRLVCRAELIAALAVTAAIVVAHLAFMQSAGALWRDEANTVSIATRPTLAEFWTALEFESYPALWPLVIRAWDAAGPGATDDGLRLLGLCVGLAVLAALWWQARALTGGPPLVALVLVGASPTLIRWGDSMRAYGLGSLAAIVMLAAVWRVVERPTRWRMLAAAVSGVIAVQVLFHSAILLACLCAGGAAVGLRRRDWRRPAALMAVGLPAALSIFINWVNVGDVHGWKALIKTSIDLPWIAHKFNEAVAASGDLTIAAWIAVLAIAMAACVFLLCGRGRRGPAEVPVQEPAGASAADFGAHPPAGAAARPAAGPADEKDMAIFVLTSLLVAAACYTAFLLALSYTTEAWYYLLIMVLGAVLCDAVISLLVRSCVVARAVRLVLCIAVVVAMAPHVWGKVHIRMTNLDLVAATLEAEAGKDDLVVMAPWWPGITFSRYYHGPAPWVTVPDIADHRTHRFDLMRERIMEADPMRPTLARMEAALRTGHRVWFVGAMAAPSAGPEPVPPPPMPGGPGWYEGTYDAAWLAQVSWLIRTHGAAATPVDVPVGRPVNLYENMPLVRVEGWR